MLYSGICEGGPFDGKPLHHGEPVMPIAMRGNRVETWFGKSTEEITVHEYRHRDGKWVWTSTSG